jgi:hypothetical protein
MKISKLALLLLLGSVLSGAGWSEPVVRVSSIQGPGKLEIKEGDSWSRAYVEMDAEQGDQLKTTLDTMASLRFLLGGRANLDKGTHIEIVSERDIKLLQSGTFWAKIDSVKRGEQVRIQTAGGVMGIRGTEFVVQVDGDNTTLSLLEGEVEVIPAQGERYLARPGSKVRFGLKQELRAVLMESEQTLSQAAETLRDSGIDVPELRQALRDPELRRQLFSTSRQLRREEGATSDPRERWGALNTLLENDLRNLHGELFELRGSLFRARQELRQAEVEVRQARIKALQAGIEARRGARQGREGILQAQEALRQAGLNPGDFGLDSGLGTDVAVPESDAGQVTVLSSRPPISWNDLPGQNFVVMVLDDTDDSEVHWMDTTDAKSYQYPQDAKALSPGIYRYRILPVDENGQNPEPGVDYLFKVETP